MWFKPNNGESLLFGSSMGCLEKPDGGLLKIYT
jgi:hypothetical protein